MSQVELNQMLKNSGNTVCADCEGRGPRWASVTFGVFICMRCAGHHRQLGTHISRVKSVSEDVFDATMMKRMKEGGNSRVNAVLEAGRGAEQAKSSEEGKMAFIKAKYEYRRYAKPGSSLPWEAKPAKSSKPTQKPGQTYFDISSPVRETTTRPAATKPAATKPAATKPAAKPSPAPAPAPAQAPAPSQPPLFVAQSLPQQQPQAQQQPQSQQQPQFQQQQPQFQQQQPQFQQQQQQQQGQEWSSFSSGQAPEQTAPGRSKEDILKMYNAPSGNGGMMNPNMAMNPGMMNPNMAMNPGMMNPNMAMNPGMMNPNMAMNPGMMNPNMAMNPGMMNPNMAMNPGMMNPNMAMNPGMMNPNMGMVPGMMNPNMAMNPGMMNPNMGMMNPNPGMMGNMSGGNRGGMGSF